MAAPNATWAARTVAAKCHPKFTPNKPTPNPCTTGLNKNPTPTAIPHGIANQFPSLNRPRTKIIPKQAPFQKW
jgi:hypothetical protein